MALSNIFREPRREITESAVGLVGFLVIIVPLCWLDYQLALTTNPTKPREFWLALLLVGPVMMLVAGLLATGAALLTHSMGEGICNTLEERGVHLRPRNRPGR